MAWIESHQNLGRHPKLLRLAAKLRINKAQSIGHLQYLWWWALDFSPTGELSAFTPAEISAASEWTGDSELFYSALKETGWLDPDGKLHDWDHYAGAYLGGLERQRRYRAKTHALRNSNATVTTNLTIPNQTKKEKVKKEKFVKPDPGEVSAYAKSLGYNLDGKKFCDYYESKGWLIGKTPMKSWQAAVRTWKTNDSSANGGPDKPNQAERDAKQREGWANRGLCTMCGSKLSLAIDGKMRCDSCNCEAVSSLVKFKGI